MVYAIEGFIKRKLNVAVRVMSAQAGILIIYQSYSYSFIGHALTAAVIVIGRIGRKNGESEAKNEEA